jgi:hypothetical protein
MVKWPSKLVVMARYVHGRIWVPIASLAMFLSQIELGTTHLAMSSRKTASLDWKGWGGVDEYVDST